MTFDQIVAVLQAAKQLRPGTAWNMRGETLEQADDEAPRVTVPTMDEINAQIAILPLD